MDIERDLNFAIKCVMTSSADIVTKTRVEETLKAVAETAISNQVIRESATSEEVQYAIEELSQASDRLHYSQDGAHVKTPISRMTIDLAITALRQLDKESLTTWIPEE